MQIEIRLKKLLKDYGKDAHGIASTIADKLDVHRHTIGKLYRNQAANPSLEVLGRLCDWLIENGVPAEILPQALFGAEPSGLWQAISEPGTVTIYLGEYLKGDRPVMRFVARRDSTVASEIARFLSIPTNVAGRRPIVRTRYVPFPFADARSKPKQPVEELAIVQRMYNSMLADRATSSAIIVGSQRVNHVLEHFVADVFKNCVPFRPTRGDIRVPFHLCREDPQNAMESCFGGVILPGTRKPADEGLYYLDANHKWSRIPWVDKQRDAGVVIVQYEPGNKAIQLALFGFSGRGTEVLGNHLVLNNAERFWPPRVEHKGRAISVYIVGMELDESNVDAPEEHLKTKGFQVIELDRQMLKSYLA